MYQLLNGNNYHKGSILIGMRTVTGETTDSWNPTVIYLSKGTVLRKVYIDYIIYTRLKTELF